MISGGDPTHEVVIYEETYPYNPNPHRAHPYGQTAPAKTDRIDSPNRRLFAGGGFLVSEQNKTKGN